MKILLAICAVALFIVSLFSALDPLDRIGPIAISCMGMAVMLMLIILARCLK